MDVTSVERALGAAAAFGPFFDPAAATPPADGWRPLRELLDPAVLRRRVDLVGEQLSPGAPVEPRVAASLDHLGVAARLVSPVLAAAAACGVVPELGLDTVWWRDADGPFVIGVPDRGSLTGVTVAGPGAAARAIGEQLLEPLALPLARAYGEAFRLAAGLQTGNLASALAGAATMIAAARRPLQIAPVAVVAELVRTGLLAGAGEYVTRPPGSAAVGFVRHSCCLFYRVPGGAKCADCALHAG